MTDLDWRESFRSGDPEVFNALVTRESPRLIAYALRLTGDRALAEDLVQNVRVQAYRSRRSYAAKGPLVAWLLAICRREAAALRRQERRQMVLSTALAQRAGQDSEALEPDCAGSELGETVIAAVADLPEQQRNVLVCRILEDRSTRDTAMHLGIAEGTVKATMHQALKKLRNIMRGASHE